MLVWSASQELRWSRKVDSFWLFAIGPQCRITCKAGSKQVSQALLNKLDATIDMGLPSPPTSIHPLNHQASKPAPPQSKSSSRAPIESEVRILVQESSSTCTLWVQIQSTLWFLSQSTCTHSWCAQVEHLPCGRLHPSICPHCFQPSSQSKATSCKFKTPRCDRGQKMFWNHQWLVFQRLADILVQGFSPSFRLSLVLCTSAHKYEHFCKGDKIRRPASYKIVQAFAHHGLRVVQHAQNDSGTCALWFPCFYVTYEIYKFLHNAHYCCQIRAHVQIFQTIAQHGSQDRALAQKSTSTSTP